jgi:aminoglycoside phosphotransferase (APT) family kinase protein
MTSQSSPTNVSHVDASFVQKILNLSKVENLQIAPLGGAEGFLGSLYLIRCDNHLSFVIKFPPQKSDNPIINFMIKEWNLNAHEKFFYDHVAPWLTNVPRCYASNEKEGAGFLALEYVGPPVARPQPLSKGLDLDQSIAAVKTVAQLHSMPFKHQKVKKCYENTFKKVSTKWFLEQLYGYGWPAFKEEFVGDEHAAIVQKCTKLRDAIEMWLNSDHEVLEQLLAHGDLWSNNLLFKDDGSVVILDFQWCNIGSDALSDITFLMYSSISTAVLQQHEIDIVRTYHSTMRELVPEFPEWDTFLHYYGSAKVLGFIKLVASTEAFTSILEKSNEEEKQEIRKRLLHAASDVSTIL